jgi:hypothetical protein
MSLAHVVTLSGDEGVLEVFKWVDTLISNTKRFIDGEYHGRDEDKRLYPEESAYRFSLRCMELLLVDRLLNTFVLARESSPVPSMSGSSGLVHVAL